MVADHLENFILGLIDMTQKGKLKWKEAEKIEEWGNIKEIIKKTEGFDFKDYYIDGEKSYILTKNNGYVFSKIISRKNCF